jgi:hypothetical protein
MFYNRDATLLCLVAIVALSIACASSPLTVKETVVVTQVVTPADAPAILPTVTSASPTETPLPTPTSVQRNVAAATARSVLPTRPPLPSPTPPRLLVQAIPGPFKAQIIYPDYAPAARTQVWFQVKAHDPNVGSKDGAGIKAVDFQIADSTGEVYRRTENNAPFCAFGDNQSNCNAWVFADYHNTWPSGKPIQSGHHTLQVTVHPANGDKMSQSITFEIQLAQ